MAVFRACMGPRLMEEIDRSGHGLRKFPEDVVRHRKRLLTLILDGNALKELPQTIGTCSKLQKLSVCNNELELIPGTIGRLSHLQELNISHNAGLVDVPQDIRGCKSLVVLDVSATGIQALPDAVSQLSSLQQLTVNDSELKRLPPDLSSMSNLLVLEARENMLKFLPVSIASLKKLQRLDLGSNEIEALPRTIGCLVGLQELSLDENGLTELPTEISGWKELKEMDISKNAIVKLPQEFCDLSALTDLYLSENCLTELPEEIGRLKNLQLLKAESNQLTSIPDSFCKLTELREVVLSDNSLETLPSDIGQLKKLSALHVDKNQLTSIPFQIGDCEAVHILTFRDNLLTEIPRSIGQLSRLRVLDLACNQIQRLPYSIAELGLSALWLNESQPKPVPKLEKDIDTDSGDVFATCDQLPQKPRETDSDIITNSANEERRHRDDDDDRHVAFAPLPGKPAEVPPIIGDERGPSVLQRQKTPYRNELKEIKSVARRKILDEKRLSVASRSLSVSPDLPREPAEAEIVREPGVSLGISVAGGTGVEQPFRDDDDGVFITKIREGGLAHESGRFQLWDKVLKVNDTNFEGISHDDAVGFLKNAVGKLHFHLMREILPAKGEEEVSPAKSHAQESPSSMVVHQIPPPAAQESPRSSKARPDAMEGSAQEAEESLGDLDKHLEDSISEGRSGIHTDVEEVVILTRVNGSLGMSIVGGNDSSSLPFAAAGSVNVFISKVVPDGAADRCGKLRMGDRILTVDDEELTDQSHSFAVSALMNSGEVVKMRVRHDRQPSGLVNVQINRAAEERLGISIKGGVDSRPGNPVDSDDEGIFVSKIRDESAASKCTQLRIGQRLVEVNGQTLLGSSHLDAVSLLKDAQAPVKLLLCDGYDEALARSVSPADSLRESLKHISPPPLSPTRSDANSELPSPPEVAQDDSAVVPSSSEAMPPPPASDDQAAAQEDNMPAPPTELDDQPTDPGEDLPPPPMDA